MKRCLFIWASLALAIPGHCAIAETQIPPASKSGPRYELQATHRRAAEAPPAELTDEERRVWQHDHSRRLEAMVRAILERYPRDVDRWEAVIAFTNGSDQLDEDALGQARQWIEQLLATDDVLEDTRERARRWQFEDRFEQTLDRPGLTPAARLQALRALLDSYAHASLDARGLHDLELQYFKLLLASAPDEVDAYLRDLRRRGNADGILRSAEALLIRQSWERQPRALRFDTFDAQTIDLADLRGKIVVLHFWASQMRTRPTKFEQLRSLADHYGKDGVVLIGICCDDAKVHRSDLLDVQTEKMTSARAAFHRFLLEHKITWPQYFDGLGFDNSIARQCGVVRIPNSYVLDRNGRLVLVTSRDEDLSATVQRLISERTL